MKVERADVEALLALAEQVQKNNRGLIAELCRTWLAVADAPAGEVGHVCTDDAGAECHVYRRAKFDAALLGQRVRLVPEASQQAGEE